MATYLLDQTRHGEKILREMNYFCLHLIYLDYNNVRHAVYNDA